MSGYDGASGASAVDVHAETLSRTKVKAGVSQGADKSAGIAAAVNYVDQNDKAEAELGKCQVFLGNSFDCR